MDPTSTETKLVPSQVTNETASPTFNSPEPTPWEVFPSPPSTSGSSSSLAPSSTTTATWSTTVGVVDCPWIEDGSQPGDRRTNTTALRIAQFNAEFLMWRNGASQCPGVCSWSDQSDLAKHMDRVSNIIAGLDADILTIAEVHDCRVLKVLLDTDALADMGYKPYLIAGKDTYTGQNVGLITRVDPVSALQRTEERHDYPVPGSRCNATGTGDAGVSKHAFAEFDINGRRMLLATGHLYAFPNDPYRCSKREAQAAVLTDVMKEMAANADDVVVLGDFNDYSATTLDAFGNVPNSRVLEIFRHYDSFDALTGEMEETANTLESVTERADKERRYSAWWDADDSCVDEGGREHSQIDHILVSPDLFSRLESTYFDHSYTISCATYASDHWPILAHFSVPQAGSEPSVPIDTTLSTSASTPSITPSTSSVVPTPSVNSTTGNREPAGGGIGTPLAVVGALIVGGVFVVGIVLFVRYMKRRNQQTRTRASTIEFESTDAFMGDDDDDRW